MEIGPAHIEALALAEGLEARPAHLERVARVVGEDLSRWAFGQWALRARAASRFDQAHLMLFTAEALEQATHPAVAAYHANLFPSGELVVDCTCGIGSDLIAFAHRGPVLGFDLDPERVAYARWNLAALGLSGEVVLGSSLLVPWTARYAYADPARRVAGRRTLRLSEFTPSIPEMVARFAKLEVGLLKLSPACDLAELCSLGSVEMVSFGRQCREALVRVGGDGRSAYHVESGARWTPSPSSQEGRAPLTTYIAELDPALARWAVEPGPMLAHDLVLADQPTESPWLRWYQVEAELDLQRTKAWLKERNEALDAVKPRNIDLDPRSFELRVNPKGALRKWVAIIIGGKPKTKVFICHRKP